MVALREAGNLPTKSFTKAQAEALLTSFVANGWLMLSPYVKHIKLSCDRVSSSDTPVCTRAFREGRYTLSSRAVMELQPYLKSTYEDEVLECTSCLEIVTKVWVHGRARSYYHPNNRNIPVSRRTYTFLGHIVLYA